MQPIEDALRESEEPSQHRIEEILHVQQKVVRQSKQRSFLTDQTEMDDKEKPFMDQVMAVVEQKYMDSEFWSGRVGGGIRYEPQYAEPQVVNVETGFSTSQFSRNYRLDVRKDTRQQSTRPQHYRDCLQSRFQWSQHFYEMLQQEIWRSS